MRTWAGPERVPVPSSRVVQIAFYVAILVMIGLFGWLFLQVVHLGTQTHAQNVRVHQLATTSRAAILRSNRNAEAARRLAAQVRRLGGKPVVHATAPIAPVSVAGTPGLTGLTGLTGDPGPVGRAGQPGPRGAAGLAGKTGAAGVEGVAGAPGTTGPVGPPGPKGDPGTNGSNGTDGTDGKPGYPDSFTYTAGGTTYTCTDPDGDHAYTCAAPAAPPPAAKAQQH